MKSPQSLLLASTALLAVMAVQPQAYSATAGSPVTLAQVQLKVAPEVKVEVDPKAEAEKKAKEQAKADKKEEKAQKKEEQKAAAPAKPESKPETKADAKIEAKPAAEAQPKQPEKAAPPQRADGDRREMREQRREERRDSRRDRQTPPPAAATAKPDSEPSKSAAPAKPASEPAKSEPTKTEAQKAAPAPAAEQKPAARSLAPAAAPTAEQKPAIAPATPPTAEQKPAIAPATAPTAEQKPAVAPATAPTAEQKPAAAAAPTAAAAPPPPTKPRNANEFIRVEGQAAPVRGMDEVRRERQQTQVGDRLIIREGDRTIVRQDNRTIIVHNESDRFAIGARDVQVQRRGDLTTTIVVRPNGVRIITVTDRDGYMIRRVRREPNGREIVIIDNSFAGPRRDMFVELPPLRIRNRDRYIIDAGHSSRAEIYGFFTAEPIVPVERRYTVEQVRYSDPLRERMPRVDLDVHFPTGSWQLTPDQVARLAEIADGLKRAIDRNPREVFLIEGHTDAVGSDDDNLSLSDRRAEAVAVALTERFQVPSENLVTQGYGEKYLKVQTEAASRENRRVAVRRITPLLAQADSKKRR